MNTIISRDNQIVTIGDEFPTVLIGERINAGGNRKILAGLKAGNFGIVCQEAHEQVEAGADIIDINVGAFALDEKILLPQAVQAVMDTVAVPICIDSSNPEALEAALTVCPGKPLINSVTAEEKSLEKILPLVKQYKTAVIGLLQDDKGIPIEPLQRVAIARKIVEKADEIGIPLEDIIIDCMALAVGADSSAGWTTLETIRQVKNNLGVNVTLGVSNVSFGMPDREMLNGTTVAIAIANGVNCLIVNAAKVRPVVLAADLLINHDPYARRYMDGYRRRPKK